MNPQRRMFGGTGTSSVKIGGTESAAVGRDDDWFVIKVIGSVDVTDEQKGWIGREMWIGANGEPEEKPNGRSMSTEKPGFALDGTVYDPGGDPLALVRRSLARDGYGWEMLAMTTTGEGGGNNPATGTSDCGKFHRGLLAGDCVSFRVEQGVGRCLNVTPKTIPSAYNPESLAWVTSVPWVSPAGSGTLYFYYQTVGLAGMALILPPEEEGGDSVCIVGKYLGCTAGRLAFAFTHPSLCTDTENLDIPCGDNHFLISVVCTSCNAAQWVCVVSRVIPPEGLPSPLPNGYICNHEMYGNLLVNITDDGYEIESGVLSMPLTYQACVHDFSPAASTTFPGMTYTPDDGWKIVGGPFEFRYVAAWSFDPMYIKVMSCDPSWEGCAASYLSLEIYGGICPCITGLKLFCSEGMPSHYTASVTGGTGDFAVLNADMLLYGNAFGGSGEGRWSWSSEDPDISVGINMFLDGGGIYVVQLSVGNAALPFPGVAATYTIPLHDWDCRGPNTFTLDDGSTVGTGVPPATITVNPGGFLADRCLMGGACTGEFCDQGRPWGNFDPVSLVVNIAIPTSTPEWTEFFHATVTDTTPAQFGYLYEMIQTGPNEWAGIGYGFDYPTYNVLSLATATLTRTAGAWEFTATNGSATLTFSISGATDNCNEGTVLNLVSATGAIPEGDPPATATVGPPYDDFGDPAAAEGICQDNIPSSLLLMSPELLKANGVTSLPELVYRDYAAQISRVNKPGSEMRRLLREMGLKESASCPCKQRARLMDQWGLDGCKARREIIEEWLRDQAKAMGWMQSIRTWLAAAKAGVFVDPRNPVKSIVDEVFRRAEERINAKPT